MSVFQALTNSCYLEPVSHHFSSFSCRFYLPTEMILVFLNLLDLSLCLCSALDGRDWWSSQSYHQIAWRRICYNAFLPQERNMIHLLFSVHTFYRQCAGTVQRFSPWHNLDIPQKWQNHLDSYCNISSAHQELELSWTLSSAFIYSIPSFPSSSWGDSFRSLVSPTCSD